MLETLLLHESMMSQLSHILLIFIKILFIFIVGNLLVRLVERRSMRALSQLYTDEFRILLLSRLVRYSGQFIIWMAVLYECGIKLPALLGAAGIVGVSVSFAAKTSVANIISGLFLMIERPFSLGSTISVEGFKGIVIDVSLFSIMLKLDNGEEVRIPHEKLLKASIVIIKDAKES
ncbi:MAG: mechanosensitive ion channel domain-containing protein [Candidatus Babeliales bacterium]